MTSSTAGRSCPSTRRTWTPGRGAARGGAGERAGSGRIEREDEVAAQDGASGTLEDDACVRAILSERPGHHHPQAAWTCGAVESVAATEPRRPSDVSAVCPLRGASMGRDLVRVRDRFPPEYPRAGTSQTHACKPRQRVRDTMGHIGHASDGSCSFPPVQSHPEANGAMKATHARARARGNCMSGSVG